MLNEQTSPYEETYRHGYNTQKINVKTHGGLMHMQSKRSLYDQKLPILLDLCYIWDAKHR